MQFRFPMVLAACVYVCVYVSIYVCEWVTMYVGIDICTDRGADERVEVGDGEEDKLCPMAEQMEKYRIFCRNSGLFRQNCSSEVPVLYVW